MQAACPGGEFLRRKRRRHALAERPSQEVREECPGEVFLHRKCRRRALAEYLVAGGATYVSDAGAPARMVTPLAGVTILAAPIVALEGTRSICLCSDLTLGGELDFDRALVSSWSLISDGSSTSVLI